MTRLKAAINDSQLLSPQHLDTLNTTDDHSLYLSLKQRFKLPENRLYPVLEKYFDIEDKRQTPLLFDKTAEDIIDKSIQKAQRLIPVFDDAESLTVLTDLPFQPQIKTLETTLKKPVKVWLKGSVEMTRLLQDQNETTDTTALKMLLDAAIFHNASDIHINSTQDGASITLRINGDIYPYDTLEDSEKTELLALIKYHAHLDIGCVNLPQDGRMSHEESENSVTIDIRVATLPTLHGEDIVLRLFNPKSKHQNLETIGLSPTPQTVMKKVLNKKSGLILVTGPTGAGKTTTLYAMLRHLQAQKRQNIVTLEDPIEMALDGIRQSQINPRIDYTFLSGLKASLRQDPDVIMIGEIRDKKTAEVALEAAYTGHLIVSTLHTSDCKGSLMRLLSFDVDPFLLSHSLLAIFSQSLVTMPCNICESQGCSHCQFSGNLGRSLLMECLDLSEDRSDKNLADVTTILKNYPHYTFANDIKHKGG